MSKSKLEYIWLDGYYPTQNMRSKTKVENDFSGKLEDCPIWSFDGSSTKQASGGSSDCLLKPVAIYPDPARRDGFLVMTEVLNADGTPHVSNGRATIEDEDNDFWFGFEQEYFIMDTKTQLTPWFPNWWISCSSRNVLLFCRWKKYSWKRISRETCRFMY
jgi:glutamine synthetase